MPAHKTPIDALWFIGAQSERMSGVLNVMVGAQKVPRRIHMAGWAPAPAPRRPIGQAGLVHPALQSLLNLL